MDDRIILAAAPASTCGDAPIRPVHPAVQQIVTAEVFVKWPWPGRNEGTRPPVIEAFEPFGLAERAPRSWRVVWTPFEPADGRRWGVAVPRTWTVVFVEVCGAWTVRAMAEYLDALGARDQRFSHDPQPVAIVWRTPFRSGPAADEHDRVAVVFKNEDSARRFMASVMYGAADCADVEIVEVPVRA